MTRRLIVPLVLVSAVIAASVWFAVRAPGPPATATDIASAATVEHQQPASSTATLEADAPVPEPTEHVTARAPAVDAPARTRLFVVCVSRGDGRPLPGVLVRLRDASIQVSAHTDKHAGRIGEALVTSGDGRVEFDVNPGLEIDVRASQTSGAAQQISSERTTIPGLAPGEARELRIEHDAGGDGRFHGRVVTFEDEHPIEGARVMIEQRTLATTDRDGRFELAYTTWNLQMVEIEAEGYALASVSSGPGSETPATARKIALQRPAKLIVALQMPAGGAQVRVELAAHRYELAQEAAWQSPAFDSSNLHWSAAPDALGVCSFDALPPGIRLRARVQSKTQTLFTQVEPIVLAPAETRRVEWDLRSGCRIIGHAREIDGRAAAGVSLWLMKAESGWHAYVQPYQSEDVVARAKSAADGEFAFENVSAGAWQIVADPTRPSLPKPEAEAIAALPLAVEIVAGEREKRVDYTLHRGLYIRGELLAQADDEPIEGHAWGRASTGELVNAQIGEFGAERGAFKIGPLASGTYDLQFNGYGNYLPARLEHVAAGTQDLVVRLRTGAVVAGRTVDAASGARVQAAICIAAQDSSGSTPMTMTRSAADGTFRFEGLAPALYSVSATTPTGTAGVTRELAATFGAPLENVLVELKPAARLRVRYEGTTDLASLLLVANGARLMSDGVHAGTQAVHVVPPGAISVELSIQGEASARVQSISVAAGEEKEVVFRQSDAR